MGMRRLVLGTVQTGMPYGRHRQFPVMTEAEAFRIFDAAWDMGVRAFDTAEAYGEAPARIRAWSRARGRGAGLEVVTKCAVGPAAGSPGMTRQIADAAITRLDGIGALVLLTHGAASDDEWAAVVEVAGRRGVVAGQSVYTPEEVTAACGLPGTGRVQAPGNILDSRALAARGDSPIPLDIRSVYLQGVLLDSPDLAERRAPGAHSISKTLQSAAAALGRPLAPLLVASVLHAIRHGDRVVLGVDDASQLEAFRAAVEIDDDTIREFHASVGELAEDPAAQLIIDPRKWPKSAAP